MSKKKCCKCGYEWETRKKAPKACPSCKRYIREGKSYGRKV